MLRQAAAAFERAGYVFGRMLVLGNLSITFAELGLWRHACRLGEQCMALAERMGAPLNRTLEMGAVLKWQLDLGDLAGVRAGWPAYDALVDSLDEPVTRTRPRAVGRRTLRRRGRHRRRVEAAARLPAPGARAQPRLRAVCTDPAGPAAAAAWRCRRGAAGHAARHRLPARARLRAHRLRPEPGHLVVAQPRAGRPGPRRRSLGRAAAGAGADAGGGAQRARRRPAPQLPEQAAGQPPLVPTWLAEAARRGLPRRSAWNTCACPAAWPTPSSAWWTAACA